MSRKIPKKCPSCGAGISMGSNRGPGNDGTKIGWSCAAGCGAFSFAECEHPDITKGKRMAKDFKDVHCMDKKMTELPTNVQLGILRANQHPHDEHYGYSPARGSYTTFIDPVDKKRKDKPEDHTCDVCR